MSAAHSRQVFKKRKLPVGPFRCLPVSGFVSTSTIEREESILAVARCDSASFGNSSGDCSGEFTFPAALAVCPQKFNDINIRYSLIFRDDIKAT